MTADSPSAPDRLWRYKAEAPDGEVVRGEVSAATEADAIRLVQRKGMTPFKVTAAQAERAGAGARGLSGAETVDFVRGLADLIEAGLPLNEALPALAEHERRRRLKSFLQRVESRVRSGDSLSAALRADGVAIPRDIPAIAEAGEASGLLGRNLRELAEQMEQDRALRQELAGQLLYPGVLVVLFFATLLFLAHFILPEFEQVFAGAGAEPPRVTQAVFSMAAFLRVWGIWIPALALAIAVAVQALARAFPKPAERVARLVPGYGWMRDRMAAVRYGRVLGLLLSTGASLARAEPIARSSLGSVLLRDRHAAAATEVRAGIPLAEALARHQAIPAEAVRLVRLGERTGQLDRMLLRAADLLDATVRRTLKRAVELIGPAMIVILGICIGLVMIAVFLGALSLNEAAY